MAYGPSGIPAAESRPPGRAPSNLAFLVGLLWFLTAAPAHADGVASPPPPPPPPHPATVYASGSSPAVPLGARSGRVPCPPPVVRPCPEVCPEACVEACVPAKKPCADVTFDGYLQFWWRILEETQNGRIQPWTGDQATDVTSGFSIRRARLAANIDVDRFRGRIELELAGTPRLMDAYATLSLLGGRVDPYIGQMKIPSTYEIEMASRDLDFVTRSVFSAQVANWSLARSPSNPSPMFGIRTFFRDLGLAVKGRLGGFTYFLMAGNGLGANLWIGGREDKEYLWANDPGAYFYGGRATYDLIHPLRRHRIARTIRSFVVGGHYNTNDHPNAVFNDEKTVLDLKRTSWSADVRINILDRVRLTGMIGAGAVEDDFDHDGKTDYDYSGWEVKAVVVAIPNRLEVGARYDVYEDEFFENGAVDELDSVTVGLNYEPWPYLRLQLDYVWRSLTSPTKPDLHDNSLVLVVQFQF